MIQDWDFTGFGAPVALIAGLFEDVPAFRSLKVEVVPAGVKYSQVLEATGGRLHVAGGWAVGQMIEGLDRGVHAFMPTGMHEIYCEIHRRYTAGDRGGAQALFRELLPVLAFANQHLDISIHFFKRLLHAEGLYPTDRVRPPVLPFDRVHRQTADELIDHVLELTRRLDGGGGRERPEEA
jgi:4-hydroxy-tetrahydrodipicolinate synthase